jgi:hypothetical protein
MLILKIAETQSNKKDQINKFFFICCHDVQTYLGENEMKHFRFNLHYGVVG